MLNRREFLKAGTVTLLLIPISRSLSGCGSSGPGGPSGPACSGVSSVSTVVLAHSHTLCVPATDLTAPPAGGRTYNTDPAGAPSHFHMVTLSQADLTSLNAGQSVNVSTTTVDGHTHDYAILGMAPVGMEDGGGPYMGGY